VSLDGVAAARRLPLPTDALVAASDEVKAWQTLEHAGSVRRDPRFREVLRDEPWDGRYRELRRSYVEGFAHAGLGVACGGRGALRRWCARSVRSGSRPLVIASHGMAMTVSLRSRGCVTEPGTFLGRSALSPRDRGRPRRPYGHGGRQSTVDGRSAVVGNCRCGTATWGNRKRWSSQSAAKPSMPSKSASSNHSKGSSPSLRWQSMEHALVRATQQADRAGSLGPALVECANRAP
jgi:hypothetical protein